MPLRVSKTTPVSKLATAIGKELKSSPNRSAIIECMGPIPVSIAAKAVAIANGPAAVSGNIIVMIPYMEVITASNTDDSELGESHNSNALFYQIKMFTLLEFSELR